MAEQSVSEEAITEEVSTEVGLRDSLSKALDSEEANDAGEANEVALEPSSESKEPTAVEPSDAPLEATEATQEEVYIAPPAGMTEEQKQQFERLSPSDKQFISNTYRGYQQSFTKKQMELAEAARSVQGVREAIEPHAQEYIRQGIEPAQLVKRAIAWDKAFKEDPVQAARQYLDAYGVDPEELLDVENANPQHRMQSDPAYQELSQKYQELEQWKAQQEQQYQQALQAQAQSEVTKFYESKPLFKDPGTAAQLEAEMAPVVGMLKQQNPQASNAELLEKAYAMTIYSNPTFKALSDQIEKRAQLNEQTQRTAQKQRAAASVTGAPGSDSAVNKSRSLRESLEANLEEI